MLSPVDFEPQQKMKTEGVCRSRGTSAPVSVSGE